VAAPLRNSSAAGENGSPEPYHGTAPIRSISPDQSRGHRGKHLVTSGDAAITGGDAAITGGDAAINAEDKAIDRKLKGICRGC